MTSSFSALGFEPILQRWGLFPVRIIMGLLTTSGAVLLTFYEQNSAVILWAWQLMGLSSIMYIIGNDLSHT